MTHPRPLPLVSIVIPAYNQAGFLEEAISSVLAQDYPRIELIVLDDGSSDDTPRVLERFRGRCRCERHANMGQAATLNKGWGMARGEILSYLSADDLLLPGAVTTATRELEHHPGVVLTYCDFNLIDPASKFIRRVARRDYDFQTLAVDLVCLPGPGAFFRTAAYRAAGSWNPALRQIPDFEFYVRLALQGPFLRIPQVRAAYRVHDESQSFARFSAARSEEPLRVVSALYDSDRLPAATLALKARALSNAHILSAQLHLGAGRWSAGLGHLWQALKLWPMNFLRSMLYHRMGSALYNRTAHKLVWVLNRLRG
jgi:glycosyltransferase involved in cell wall biosynthesis